jgi:hypothetical protein
MRLRLPVRGLGYGSAVVATGGAKQATLHWHAPWSANGAPITAYVVTPYKPGVAQRSVTFNTPATTATVRGLTSHASYMFAVAAKNSRGVGPRSAVSHAVVPT